MPGRDVPIIFSAPMVRALLAGQKTQTRRLAWREGPRDVVASVAEMAALERKGWQAVDGDGDGGVTIAKPSPWQALKAGDRLWVRENLKAVPERASNGEPRGLWLHYAADGTPVPGNAPGHKGCPSIHMPRTASRLTLLVEEVRVEPLHAMTEKDAQREGVRLDEAHQSYRWVVDMPDGKVRRWKSAREAFAGLWDALHGEGGGPAWSANPDVAVISFSVERQNIDAMTVEP